MSSHRHSSNLGSDKSAWTRYRGVYRYSLRALKLVWTTNRKLTFIIGILTLLAGATPAAIAYMGKLIIDQVLLAARTSAAEDMHSLFVFLGIEVLLVIALSLWQRGLRICESLLRAELGHRVNKMILEKALTLSLAQFEDSEFYDKLTRARREASQRPLKLVMSTFGLIQNGIGLLSAAVLLLQFSPWVVAILIVAGVPAFIVEAKFSGEAFRLFRWRSPESRKQMYLETVLAREDYNKEVKLFQIGPMLLDRYQAIFDLVYGEDRKLTIRRGVWGFFVGLIPTAAFYGAYAWVIIETVRGSITLGDLTMYLLLFKQGQQAVSASLGSISGMYEDNLYLSTLYELLEVETPRQDGDRSEGEVPGDGIRFENVSFAYPGSQNDALTGITFHLRAGGKLALVGENGSGKTTLIKLLTRLYEPTEGRILVDGTDVREWDPDALRWKFSVIFQDFVHYQFLLGENIGIGDVEKIEDEEEWAKAARRGMADSFVKDLPDGYQTQLGSWFKDGRELSGGQWQKIALSRAFMRRKADILVFDEPTSAMDARAEAEVFDRVREMTEEQMAILISHRFSTVRMADYILVLEDGRIVEEGSHEDLMALNGRYAALFTLQAEGYQ